MIYGHVRDDAAMVKLRLPGVRGELNIEFVLDTGYDGWLALPNELRVLVDAQVMGDELTFLPGTGLRYVPSYAVEFEWQDELVNMELLEVEGNPLLGARALRGSLIQIEMIDGGEVSVEPLD
jgi:predicted aspartyl protease